MTKRSTAKFKTIFFVLSCFFISCNKNDTFTIEGNVKNAKDKTLFLEHVRIGDIQLMDSLKLGESGNFRFKHQNSGESDFYRLRLGGQLINIPVDSTETVNIQADGSNFAQDYSIDGSDDCINVKELTLLQLKASIEYNKLQNSYNEGQITVDQYQEQVTQALNEYKDKAKAYIYANPKSMSAYFALFQQINGMLIFDPFNKEDYKVFGAVATSWNQYFPNAIRSKHLYNLALRALKSIRGERPLEYTVTDAVAHFEIKLPDIKDQQVSLSESCRGKVTLIDFTAYQMKESPVHNIALAEFYEKHKRQPLEIYQISLDTDEHFWKNAAVNLPWICVHDPASVYSKVAVSYNVKNLPTTFVMNSEGEIVKRLESTNNLEKEVGEFLK
ncbi:MAG: AhpC/TSA family protein [Dysgonamonadaceae bacterium]|jgi:hypothetical protein|nr:AhpC/TSA family protein [Dysgonamonadaceae bacterium]